MTAPAAPVSPEITIGGNVFVVSLMTAMRSFVLQPRIGPVVSEAGALFFGILGELAAKQSAGEGQVDLRALLEADLDLDKIASALGRIFVKLPPAELEAITRELLTGATMDGVPLFAPVKGDGDTFDIRMRGRTLDVWKLLWHALRVNYPDFFAALGGSGKPPSGASPSAG